ncbi:MAG: hypothetical protein QM784_31995 [Polyangiaceae bacterium]
MLTSRPADDAHDADDDADDAHECAVTWMLTSRPVVPGGGSAQRIGAAVVWRSLCEPAHRLLTSGVGAVTCTSDFHPALGSGGRQ